MSSLAGILGLGTGRNGGQSRGKKKKRKAPQRKSVAKRTAARSRRQTKAPRRTKSNPSGISWFLNARMVKYVVQQLAPYWAAIGIGAVGALIFTLWVSGVFYEMGQALGKSFDRVLISQGLIIENVELSGRVHTSKSDLKALMRLESAVPFMKYDIDGVRERIEELDWVERATVLRLWPNTIRVSLVEKRPIAVWQMDGMFSLIDRKGEVISSDHLSEFTNLPHLVGQGAAEAAPEFVDLLSRFPVLNSRLRAALRIGERRWTLRLDNGLNILLPDENEEQALTLLVTLDEKYRLLARQVEVIDMRDLDRLYLKLENNEVLDLDDMSENASKT